jgi:hypothetical protein
MSNAADPSAARNRRGCDWDDYNNSFHLLLMAQPPDVLAKAIAGFAGGKVVMIDPSHTDEKHPDMSGLVFRHAGQKYGVAVYPGLNLDVAQNMSKGMRTRTISLLHDDTSGWTEYRVFENGENVETYTWGEDYSEEMAEFADETGDEGITAMNSDKGRPWDHRQTENGEAYQFRSSLRKVDAAEVTKSEPFLDAALRAVDAWLPDWSNFPWCDEETSDPQSKPPFEAAYQVKRN